jgi:hypothetical protein
MKKEVATMTSRTRQAETLKSDLVAAIDRATREIAVIDTKVKRSDERVEAAVTRLTKARVLR